MTTRFFLLLTATSTALITGLLFFLLARTNPVFATPMDFLLIFVTAFAATTGILALMGVAVRVHVRKEGLLIHHVVISFRQAALLSGVIVFALVLSAHNVLVFWSAAGLVLVAALLEWFFQRPKLT